LSTNKAYDRTTQKNNTPKTKKSVRILPPFPEAVELLEEIKQHFGNNHDDIFWFIGKTASTRSFRIACDKIGIHEITIHTMRHIFTTRCVEHGVDEKVIQKWLGHDKIDLSMNLYAHANGNFEHEQILKMAKHSR